MLFTSIGVGAAEDAAKPEPDSSLALKAEILGALGVAKISAGSLLEDSTVTRETFSEGIASMMLDDLAGVGLSPVGDLSEEDIGMLYLRSIGILNGTGENVFEPNSPVTLEQAAKIAVSALGFGEISEYKGGYFIGYVNEARRLGLLDGIGASASEELNTADYVNLMYNLLDVDILERKTFGSSDTYYRTDGNTLISVYRNIRKGEGVVTANKYSGLYSENSGTSADKVTIGSEDYAIGETNAGNSLGLYAEFYYYDNPRKNEDKKLLYITTEKDNDRLLITEDKISGYSGGTYTYEDENGRNRSVKIPSDAVILYNGVFKASLEAEKFIPAYGSVEFISNDGDAAYEVVKIENITVTSVLSVSSDGLAVYDKYEPEYNLNLEDKDYTVTLDNGKDGTVLSILKDSIAETLIADGGDRQYYDIRVVTNSVSGAVEKIQSVNITKLDETTSEEKLVSVPDKIFADGKEYKTSVRFKNLAADGKLTAPEAGKAYVFLLNGRGEIADIGENPEKPYRIGYVKRFATDDAVFNPKYKVRLFDESGAWETYDLADKVRFNGSSMRAEDLKGLDSLVGKVCKYELNVAGDVTSLCFPSETDDSFRTVYTMKEP